MIFRLKPGKAESNEYCPNIHHIYDLSKARCLLGFLYVSVRNCDNMNTPDATVSSIHRRFTLSVAQTNQSSSKLYASASRDADNKITKHNVCRDQVKHHRGTL